MRQANRTGPLGKVARYAAVVAAVAAAIALYLNFDTVRQIRFDFSEITDLFADDPGRSRPGEPAPSPDELPTEVVEGGAVAGDALPTSLDGETPTADDDAAEPPTVSPAAPAPIDVDVPPPRVEPAAEIPPAAVADALPPAAPPREPEPERPVAPEMFHFGLSTVTVTEADASAAVIVLRDGGRRGASSFTWWTTDGTATAGTDYASLGEVVQQFAAGQQNVTIRVPIIGDRNAEGPETFYVHLAPSAAAAAAGEAPQRLEVVVNDDDR